MIAATVIVAFIVLVLSFLGIRWGW